MKIKKNEGVYTAIRRQQDKIKQYQPLTIELFKEVFIKYFYGNKEK